jgi:hypothetical protein
LKFRTSRKIRFFLCDRTVVRSYQTEHVFVSRDFLSRPLTNIQRSLRTLREARTLPRSPRFNWRAGKPDAPRDLPSGTESRLMNAARARVYATAQHALGATHYIRITVAKVTRK